MKPLHLAVFLTLVGTAAFAQVPDSLFLRYDSLRNNPTSRLDSTSNHINGKIDSAQLKLNNFLNPDLKKLTSRLRPSRISQSDSLRSIHELDSTKAGLTHKIDSLKGLNLPAEKYTRKLDSLNQIGPAKYVRLAEQRKQQLENKVTKPVADLNEKINQPINTIEGKVNDKLDLMRNEGGEGANLPGNLSLDNASLPNTNIGSLPGAGDAKIPGTGIDNPLDDLNNPLGNVDNPISGQANQLGEVKEKATELKSIPQQQIGKVTSIDGVQTAREKVGDMNTTTDKIQAYESDVKNIAQGNVGEVKQIPDALENKAKSLDEIKELEKQTGELNKVKDMAGKGNDPEALKQMAKQEVIKKATDHFAGKQEALKAAMDKVSKLKSKYSEVKSLADLPKRPPNPMKGKPLIERIIPGVTMQIQRTSNFMIDINPVVSYRFTGRINAGLGWNERLSFMKWNKLSPPERIYGPRVFGSFAFKSGFGVKAEIEKMNTIIPPYTLSPDAGTRQWVWSAFVGLKKDYKFIGKVNGNVQILYNVFDDHDNSPYGDRLNVRMGFEFPMKKKKRTPQS